MRYACYCISVLLLFVLVAFVNRTVVQIHSELNAAGYLHQLAGQAETLYQAPAEASSAYGDAPAQLQTQNEFLELKRRHLRRIEAATEAVALGDADHSPQELGATIAEDLTQHHAAALTRAKKNITEAIVGATALTLAAISLLIFPLFASHSRSMAHISKSNEKLRRQSDELRTLHVTTGNMLEDIVHQKKQSSRTSQVNARLAAIINSADDAIFSLNLAGFITTANLAAAKLFGFHCEGKRFSDLLPADVGAQIRSLLMVTEEQNSGSTMDLTMQKQQRVDLSLTISPIRSEDQRITGFSVIAKDISNSKLEEERFRLAVEAAPNAMIMVNSRGIIVLFNSEAERMFGYKREQLHGQPLNLLLPQPLRATHSEHVQHFVSTPHGQKMGADQSDLYGQRKSGALFPIEVGLTPIDIDHETYVISSIVDISERLAQQKSLTDLNQELSRKNQEMEQFIYTVSHDLKAPLVTIAGFTNRLLHAKDEPLPAVHQHKLQRILANVKSMESLLQDLLHLSRVIKRDLTKEDLQPERTLNKALGSLDGIIHATGAEIRLHPPFKPIYAQERLLFQCVQNVISNAIKYTAERAVPQVDIETATAPGFTGIRVADKGIGIAPRHQQRIFNVFERLHPDAGEGTGVGLSIVKTIIEKHGGKIELTSAEGEGTAFTLLFPNNPVRDEG